jgi:hypothetical protein
MNALLSRTILILGLFWTAALDAHTDIDKQSEQHKSTAKPSKVVDTFLGNPVYGSPWPKSSKIESIDTALIKYQNKPSDPMIFSGEITKVCEKKGCWMILAHNGEFSRINFNNHGFFIPKESRGFAMVYGVLNNKTLSEKFRKHLAEDEGQDTKNIKGTEDVFEVLATSVVIFNKE